jgi:hypothetical protein
MGGAQITAIILIALGLIIGAALDGEKMNGTHKFSIKLVSSGIWVFILYWGGFWQ